MRPPTGLVVVTLLGVVLAGCVDPEATVKEDNPRFTAFFMDPPTWTYDSIVTTFATDIVNVQEVKPGQEVGEGGAHQVCLRLDGEIHEDKEGRPICELVGLANQETQRVHFRVPPLPAGVYNVSILDDSTALEVRETPRFGERIQGTLAAITFQDLRELEDRWEFDVAIEWTDSETRRLMEEAYEENPERDVSQWPVEIGLWFGAASPTVGWQVDFSGGLTNVTTTVDGESQEAFAPKPGEPVRTTFHIEAGLRNHHELRYGSIDHGVFVWCCI